MVDISGLMNVEGVTRPLQGADARGVEGDSGKLPFNGPISQTWAGGTEIKGRRGCEGDDGTKGPGIGSI